MLASFILMFVSLYLAQMGDKTQLLTLYLATKVRKQHFILFLAIMTAYLISEAVVVVFGASLNLIIPHNILHIVSGIIFLILAVFLIRDGRQKKKKYKNLRFHHLFLTTMFLIFLADFGDKTQIAITLYAAANNPFLVYLAAILALGLDTVIVITFSKVIAKKINESLVERLSGVVFAIVGILLIIQAH